MTQRGSGQNPRWFFGIILGIGVGIALGVALDNIAVGIGVGVGVGVVFAAGLARRDGESKEED